MAKLLKSALLHIACISLLGTAAYGQEPLVYRAELPAHTAVLFTIRQIGNDLQLQVTEPGGNQFFLDHPSGRNGLELLALGPYPQDSEVLIELLHPSKPPDFDISSRPLDTNSNTLEAARLITEAGRLNSGIYGNSTDEVIALYASAMQQLTRDDDLAAYCKYLLALMLYEKADLSGALNVANDISATLLDNGEYLVERLVAQILFSQDQFETASTMLEKLITETTERISTGDSFLELDLAELHTTLGTALVRSGDLGSGKVHLDAALQIASDHSELEVLASIHNSYGTFYFYSGDPREAARQLNLAVEYLWDSPDTKMLSYALGNLTITYSNLGEFQLARDAAHTTLLIAEEGSDSSQLALTYQNLAALYLRLGEYHSALEFAGLSRDFELSTGREWRSYIALNLEGDALLGLKLETEAVENYLEALAYFQEQGPVNRTFTTHERLIEAYIQIGEIAKAREHLDRANSLLAANPERFSASNSNSLQATEAFLALSEGKAFDSVEKLLQVYADLSEEVQPFHVRVQAGLMRAYADLGELESAVEYGMQAVASIDQIRSQLEYSRLGPAWSAQSHDTYIDLYAHLTTLGIQTGDESYFLKAFEIAESSLATNLVQQRLAAARINPEGRERDNSYSDKLASLAMSRAATNSEAPYSRNTLEYFRTRERFQAQFDLNPVSPLPPAITLAEVQSALKAETAIVEFICRENDHCYRSVITKSSFESIPVAPYSEVAELVKSLNRSVTTPGSNARDFGDLLGDILFTGIDVTELNDIKIVSNSPLNTLPMAMLGDGDSDSGSMLVESAGISVLPSISTAILSDSGLSTGYAHDLAILADPSFSQDFVVSTLASNSNTQYVRDWTDSLVPLPWTAEEANSLGEIYRGLSVKTMTGAQATKSNLLHESSRNSRVLHIASHGYFDGRTPDLVGIATSPEAGDPGFITLEDLLLYQFNNELVVISGCETGLGETLGGEGALSLSRGFLAQGADEVLSTLWPVSDRGSAEFMRIFYQVLDKNTLNASEALREAQLTMSRHPVYRDPYYWAAYVLTSLEL